MRRWDPHEGQMDPRSATSGQSLRTGSTFLSHSASSLHLGSRKECRYAQMRRAEWKESVQDPVPHPHLHGFLLISLPTSYLILDAHSMDLQSPRLDVGKGVEKVV